MDKLKISCPCLFGLESVLSGEMKRMGAENITAEELRERVARGSVAIPANKMHKAISPEGVG